MMKNVILGILLLTVSLAGAGAPSSVYAASPAIQASGKALYDNTAPSATAGMAGAVRP